MGTKSKTSFLTSATGHPANVKYTKQSRLVIKQEVIQLLSACKNYSTICEIHLIFESHYLKGFGLF